jgi:hypothetical protein
MYMCVLNVILALVAAKYHVMHRLYSCSEGEQKLCIVLCNGLSVQLSTAGSLWPEPIMAPAACHPTLSSQWQGEPTWPLVLVTPGTRSPVVVLILTECTLGLLVHY